jgi:Mg2+-importing ATPase
MNLLTDLPEMTIVGDSVDSELVSRPRRWSIGFIRNFMVVFGLVSSLFDFVTFGVLLFLLHATVGQFRTGWFIESVVSASMVVLIIRTRRPFFKSRPSRYLMAVTLLVGAAALILPFTQLSEPFGFTRMPVYFLVIVVVIGAAYIVTAESAKKIFYSRESY